MPRVLPIAGSHQLLFAVPQIVAVQVLGVKLLGFDAGNGRKALFSVLFLVLIWLLGRFLKWLFSRKAHREERRAFWVRQGISITVAVLNILVLLSIWFDDPARLATAFGLVTAGLAFALQRVVTAFAGYVLILRGKTFNIGDRITMGRHPR